MCVQVCERETEKQGDYVEGKIENIMDVLEFYMLFCSF